MPIGAIGDPHFEDFTNPEDAKNTKTHQLIGAIHKIRQASLNADFDNKLNTKSRRRFRETESAEFFLRQSACF